jgi:hypothetical protein
MNNSILAILSVLTLSSLIGIESLCAQDHVTVKVFPAGAFATGWTHSVNTANGILWYNSQTGAGAVGRIS